MNIPLSGKEVIWFIAWMHREVYRNVGEGDKYPEPMFAILNYAKITDSPMKGEWVMEVDWVKHEYLK